MDMQHKFIWEQRVQQRLNRRTASFALRARREHIAKNRRLARVIGRGIDLVPYPGEPVAAQYDEIARLYRRERRPRTLDK